METVKITIKLPSGKQVGLNISGQDSLIEVRTFLNETTELCLHQNYHFQSKGEVLNEYVEFQSLNVQENIDIKIGHFEERSAKYHLKQVQKMLREPERITHFYGTYQKTKKPEKEATPEQSNFTIKTVLQGNLSLLTQCDSQKTPVVSKLADSLQISSQNPPPSYRKIMEDYFYITFKSLEAVEYQITASPQGFFVNNSNKRVFDPTVHQSFQTHKNLLDLFKSLSQQFQQGYQQLLDAEPSDLFLQQTYVSQQYGREWVRKSQPQPNWDQGSDYNDLYGIDTNLLGDWNEDIQICKSLPQEDFYQRINKDKTLVKVHNDFLFAAVEGAKAVVSGNIMPVNPMDKKDTQVFIYNHIFFSFALETPLNFRQELGQDTTSSVSSANCDLRNLNHLHRMDIPNLNLLNTALIDYKGNRVIAQSIIPGILNQDQQNCTQYGSIDEGMTIARNEDFHQILQAVCKQFYLEDEVAFLDQEGKEFKLAGALEVKGILGSDKRKYILDLMRLSPRDLNYLGDDNLCCVLRLELVENYVMAQYIEKANEKFAAYVKEQQTLKEEESKVEKIEEKKEEKKEENIQQVTKEDQIKEQEKKVQEELQQSLKKEQEKTINDFMKYQQFIMQSQQEERCKFKFNANIGSNMPIHNLPKEHEENLQKLADYIQNSAIPNLIKELKVDDTGRLGDSASLSELFHFFGINNRYLGNVTKRIDEKQNPNLKILLEKAIFIRSFKHMLREQMRDAQRTYLPHTIAHVFNCIFTPEKVQQQINCGKIFFEVEKFEQEKSKKKSKKQKQSSQEKLSPISSTSQTLWNRLKEIAQKRYQYDLPQNVLRNLKFNTLSALRDICQRTGIIVKMRDYNFQKSDVKNYQDFDFCVSDVVDIQPVVKNIQVDNEDVKFYMDAGQKLMSEQRLQESSEMFQTCLQILINLYGPIKKEISTCYSKLAQLFYRQGKIDQALLYQKLSLQTLKKLYGIDHYTTAHAYLHLGLFYFGAQLYKKAEKNLLKSLYLKNLIGGEAYPDINLVLWNLSMIYQQSSQFQPALDCLLESNELTKKIFGENDLRSAGIYQAIAMVHFEIDDIKRAIEYQEKSCEIFKENCKNDDARLLESQLYLKSLKEMADQKQKSLTQGDQGQTKRQFGSNKNKNKPVFPKETQDGLQDEQQQNINQQVNEKVFLRIFQERQILLEKLKMAKINLKQNRGNRNFKVFE